MRPIRSDNLYSLLSEGTIIGFWLPDSLNQTGCHLPQIVIPSCQLNFDLRHSSSHILDVLSGFHSLYSYLSSEYLRGSLLCSGAVLILNQKVDRGVTLIKLTF